MPRFNIHNILKLLNIIPNDDPAKKSIDNTTITHSFIDSLQIKLIEKINNYQLNDLIPILYPAKKIQDLLTSTTLVTGKMIPKSHYNILSKIAIADVKSNIIDRIDSLKHLINQHGNIEKIINKYFNKLEVKVAHDDSSNHLIPVKSNNHINDYIAVAFLENNSLPQVINQKILEAQVGTWLNSNLSTWEFDDSHIMVDFINHDQ